MQQIKIPVTDSGAFDIASAAIEKNSLLFNKENDTLYIKRPESTIPLGSKEDYEKGLTQFYFCGVFNLIVEWPKYGHGAVIYIAQENDINSEYIHKGFWVNLGNDITPEWKPFCEGDTSGIENFDAIPVGTIFKFLLPDENIPAGFAKCDGSSLFTYDYPELFTVTGYTYGMGTTENTLNQQNYFCLPNMEAPIYSYIIKTKSSFTNIEGTVTQYTGKLSVDKFKDISKPLEITDNLSLYLNLPDSTKENITENTYNIIPISNQYVNHFICIHNTSSLPIGSIIYTPKGYTPNGFLICDGSPVRIVDFKELYDALNSQFGREATTFNLPHIESDYVDACIYTGKATKFFIGE